MLETKEERFKVLFWKYQNLIIQVALNRTEDLFCAQDICQETFLKLFARVDLGQEDEVLKAWMIVVADNAAKDVLRKGGRYKQVSEDDVEFSEALRVRVSGSSYFDEIIRKDFRSRILDHLRSVNEEQYEIVVMTCCLGMSLEETAKRMNLTYHQVSMKLHRARKWIRKNMEDQFFKWRPDISCRQSKETKYVSRHL